jgi:hypothetical protein
MLRRDFISSFCITGLAFAGRSLTAQVSANTIPQANLVQPAELNQVLQSTDRPPLILQVGSKVFFGEAHIHNSVFAGPGSQPAGLKALETAVASQAKDHFIVLYCGCCPWGKCPNAGPAFKRMQELSFTNVKVLYIANNFGDDWASKGYPTDRK